MTFLVNCGGFKILWSAVNWKAYGLESLFYKDLPYCYTLHVFLMGCVDLKYCGVFYGLESLFYKDLS